MTAWTGLYPMESVWEKEASCFPCERIINGCVQNFGSAEPKILCTVVWSSSESQNKGVIFYRRRSKNDLNEG